MSSFDILDRECDRAGVGDAERNYYRVTMMKESGGRARAEASTSSAAGVFQFLDQTWLATLKEHGAEYGYAAYASQITRGSDGRLRAPQAVMDLRFDVTASTRMMMAFTEENGRALQAATGREPMGGDLYLAHFLGAGRADDPSKPGDQRKGAIGILTMPSSTRLRDIPWMQSTINANRSIAGFTVGQLRAWAAAKFDGRIDDIRAYDADTEHTPEETSAQRDIRLGVARRLGLSEEEIDRRDKDGSLMGTGFALLIGSILAAMFGMAQDDVTQTYDVPVIMTPAGQADEPAVAPDAGLAAAVAAVSPTLRNQTPAPADQTSPTTQLTQLARPAAPVTRAPIPA